MARCGDRCPAQRCGRKRRLGGQRKEIENGDRTLQMLMGAHCRWRIAKDDC